MDESATPKATPKADGRSVKDKDFVGKQFGRWTVLRRAGSNASRSATWWCVCSCPAKTEYEVAGVHLRSGASKSCGCLHKEMVSKTHLTHGMSKHGVYKNFKQMWRRCSNPKDKDWLRYGGRLPNPVTVCPEWNTLDGFRSDMECSYFPKATLERLNNDLGYSKSNCVWANRTTQNNNRSNNRHVTCWGVTKTIGEWSTETGIPWSTINNRLKRGLSECEAVER